MAATISQIRDGLKTRLDTIADLRPHDTIPGQVNVPAAIVVPDTGTLDATMADGSDDYIFVIRLLVSEASSRTGQDLLDSYLSATGAASVKAAIEADKRLAGVVHFARVQSWRNYGLHEYNNVSYLGAEIVVEVTA